MANLLPQAQAVLDAAYEEIDYIPQLHVRWGVAAALRAAAEQSENLYDPHEGKVSVVRVEHIRAIAAELESNLS